MSTDTAATPGEAAPRPEADKATGKTWPGWLSAIGKPAAVGAAVVAGLLGLGNLYEPRMREAARVEGDRVTAEVSADLKALEARIGERLDRMDARMETGLAEAREDRAAMRAERAAMEARIVAALNRSRPGADPDPRR